jgi:L-rhamnose mutarotase
VAQVAWTARVRPDKVDEYVRHHAAVWPDVLEAITNAGIRNYSIFLFGTRVFGYYECDDPEQALIDEAKPEAMTRWRQVMHTLFEDEVATEGATFMPQIFRLD